MARENSTSICFGSFKFDFESLSLERDGVELPLTRKSAALLSYLIENRDRIVSKNELFKNVWPDSHVDNTNLTQHIYRIRKALESNENEVLIETFPKSGYRFRGEITENCSEEPALGEIVEIFDEDIPDQPTEESFTTPSAPRLHANPSAEKREQSGSRWLTLGIFMTVVLSVSLLVLFGWFLMSYLEEKGKPRVAILPFTQIGSSHDARLELGIAETFISQLSNDQGFRVIPTERVPDTSSNHNSGFDVFALGDSLKADVLIIGSVQIEESTARVNLRYYDIAKRQTMCALKFDESFQGSFSLQDKISRKATSKLKKELADHAKHIEANTKRRQ